MDDLAQLAGLIRRRNQLEQEISALIKRPAQIGHLGEYIAARIFGIALEQSAANKGFDGQFTDGPLLGRTVNVKWYARWECLLDINPLDLPDYFLVLAGPKYAAMSSRGQTRSWLIDHVFLFDAPQLVEQLRYRGVKIGIPTSVRKQFWNDAEIYPQQRSVSLLLSDAQRRMLMLFSSETDAKQPLIGAQSAMTSRTS